MKYIFIIIGVFAFGILNAQVGIEATQSDMIGDELLFFPANADGGIVLPQTTSDYNGSTLGGELRYDTNTNTVQFYSTKTNEWTSLTNENASGVIPYTFNEVDAEGVIITTEEDVSTLPNDGILTLISNTKALALPRVPNVETLPNPQPGTICYDDNSSSLAVFNGEEWTFWN